MEARHGDILSACPGELALAAHDIRPCPDKHHVVIGGARQRKIVLVVIRIERRVHRAGDVAERPRGLKRTQIRHGFLPIRCSKTVYRATARTATGPAPLPPDYGKYQAAAHGPQRRRRTQARPRRRGRAFPACPLRTPGAPPLAVPLYDMRVLSMCGSSRLPRTTARADSRTGIVS